MGKLKSATNGKKKLILNFVGGLFLVWGLFSLAYQIYIGEITGALWMSYSGLVITGVAILFRSSFMLAGEIAIFGIPYLIWSVDFIYIATTGNSLWGITNYIFGRGNVLANVISFQHLVNIPLSLFALWLIKLKRADFWKISVVQIGIFFVVSRLVSSPEENINCVFSSCFPLNVPLPYVVLYWVVALMIIFLSSYVLVNLKFLRKNGLGRFI